MDVRVGVDMGVDVRLGLAAEELETEGDQADQPSLVEVVSLFPVDSLTLLLLYFFFPSGVASDVASGKDLTGVLPTA